MTSINPADPLHVEDVGLPALSDDELSALIQIGVNGGFWPKHKLHPTTVKTLLNAALVHPRGNTAVVLSARGIQTLAHTARRAIGDA